MASALSLTSLLALVLSRSGISFQGLFPYVSLIGAAIGGLLYLALDILYRGGGSTGRYCRESLASIMMMKERYLIDEAGDLADDQCSDNEGRPIWESRRRIIMRSLKVVILLLSALEAYLMLAFTFGNLTPLIVIPSNSMSPTLNMGDLVLIKGADPASLKVGDIIVFDVPPPYDRYTPSPVIHRVVDVRIEEGRLSFKTKGDSLSTEDPWSLPAERIRGMYSFKISFLGFPLLFMRTPLGLILSAILLLLWILYPVVKGDS